MLFMCPIEPARYYRTLNFYYSLDWIWFACFQINSGSASKNKGNSIFLLQTDLLNRKGTMSFVYWIVANKMSSGGGAV